MKKCTFLILLVFTAATELCAQGSTSRDGRRDSAQKAAYQYEYTLPILGQKAANKGFRIPKPHGIMLNFLPMRQYIQLSKMKVGFNGSELIDLDEIVVFDPTNVNGYTANLRFDTWVFPFLNVYGMYGVLRSNTKVTLVKPINLSVDVPIDGSYASLGAMVAGGFKNLFFSADFNHSWTFNDKLEDPARIMLAGFRMGPRFKLKNHEEMNLVFWGGIMHTKLFSQTDGSINANEVFPDLANDISQVQGDLDDWYNNLPPAKQVLYKPIYEKLGNGLQEVKDFGDNGTIQYSMQKKIERPWNLTIGGQWQINETWQIRAEGQFLGDRQGALISLNYRFGIKGKNLFYNP